MDYFAHGIQGWMIWASTFFSLNVLDMGNGGLNSKAMFSEKKKRSKLRKGR